MNPLRELSSARPRNSARFQARSRRYAEGEPIQEGLVTPMLMERAPHERQRRGAHGHRARLSILWVHRMQRFRVIEAFPPHTRAHTPPVHRMHGNPEPGGLFVVMRNSERFLFTPYVTSGVFFGLRLLVVM